MRSDDIFDGCCEVEYFDGDIIRSFPQTRPLSAEVITLIAYTLASAERCLPRPEEKK